MDETARILPQSGPPVPPEPPVPSPLASATKASGAVFAPTDPSMPLHFGDARAECSITPIGAVVRDACHLGRIRFSGDDHREFLHRMSTNDFDHLGSGSGREAVFTDNRGRILELGIFLRDRDQTLAVVAPGGGQRLPEWLERFHFAERLEMDDVTKEMAMIELYGPSAAPIGCQVLGSPLPGTDLALLGPVDDNGVWRARVDRFGHPGLLIAGPPDILAGMWSDLLDAGAKPLGEEAYETLRIEAGLPAHGAELTDAHNPWEATLDRAIHMDKGCYIGQEVIARLDTYDKVKQHLVGLRLPESAPVRPGDELRAGPSAAGTVTSVCQSERFGAIALAYVRTAHARPGTELICRSQSEMAATVAALPFT